MVLFCQLCSHPFEACLNSEIRPCHTLVCTGQGVFSGCGEDIGNVMPQPDTLCQERVSQM